MIGTIETPKAGRISRNLVQRIHGTIMILLGVLLAILSVYSEQTGTGMYPWLKEVPIAEAGLIQAYLLMSVAGIGVWMGAMSRDNHWKWDVLAALAHIPPLVAVLLYGYLFDGLGQGSTIYVSLAIHLTWISIELAAIFLLPSKQVS